VKSIECRGSSSRVEVRGGGRGLATQTLPLRERKAS
jgi:hypothetical protein